jgi:hypothetical protein
MRLPVVFALLALGPALLPGRAPAQQNPHGKLPEGVDCADCHTPKSWKPDPATVKFDHDRQTSFPLRGRHKNLACRSCHLDLSFADPVLRSADCATCHADVHRGAYAQRCVECHTTVSFSDMSALQVHSRTTFPLTGAHLQISCRACHVNDQLGAFTALDPQCISCHQTDFANAQSVDHSQFPTDCLRCHVTIAWTAYVRFDHPTVSNGFQLLGAHARIRCSSCHGPNLTPLFSPANDQDCFACHQPDYARAHPGNVFPTTCTQCHSVDTWSGANFDHAAVANGFRLLGAHANIPCESCHSPTDWSVPFQPTNDQDCYACHSADYQREHAGSGFPTTCLACHTIDTWGGANFANHDAQFFPIYSGAHRGRWSSCQDCHIQSNDFTVFSCFQCHQQAETDSHHRDVRNYSYDSNRCYQCHPQGRAGG